MRPPHHRFVLLLPLLFAWEQTARANAWTRDQGSFYANLSYATISASQFYGPDGTKLPLGHTYAQHVFGFYGEVGVISRWLTLSLDGTLFRWSGLTDLGHTSGLGDLRAGLWSGVLTGPVRLSVGVLVGIPLGDPLPQAGPGADTDARQTANSLPTGDGEVDVELATAAGYTFGGLRSWPLRHYALARLGYWLRTSPREAPFDETGDFPDAVTWQLELGTGFPWRYVERLSVMVRIYGLEPFAKPENNAFSGFGGGVAHRSFQLQLGVRLWRELSLSAAVAGAFSARNLPAGAQYMVSLGFARSSLSGRSRWARSPRCGSCSDDLNVGLHPVVVRAADAVCLGLVTDDLAGCDPARASALSRAHEDVVESPVAGQPAERLGVRVFATPRPAGGAWMGRRVGVLIIRVRPVEAGQATEEANGV